MHSIRLSLLQAWSLVLYLDCLFSRRDSLLSLFCEFFMINSLPLPSCCRKPLLSTGMILLLFACSVRPAFPWGKIGHEIVGNLAYAQLSNHTKAVVRNILQIREPCSDNNTVLGAVADWADTARYTKYYHWSAGLHYIDVRDDIIPGGCPVLETVDSPSNCHFDRQRDCPNNFCVAGAITNYTLRLTDDSLQPWAKNESLKFLVHFMGDITQPLHSSKSSDKGGNSIHVIFNNDKNRNQNLRSYRRRHGNEMNLHSLWDDGMIEKSLRENFDGKRQHMEANLLLLLQEARKTGQYDEWLRCAYGGSPLCTDTWGEESFMLALTWAYKNEKGDPVTQNETISDAYYQSRMPIIGQQLVKASIRLAVTLDTQLSKEISSTHVFQHSSS